MDNCMRTPVQRHWHTPVTRTQIKAPRSFCKRILETIAGYCPAVMTPVASESEKSDWA